CSAWGSSLSTRLF
nr:immunoglobulin light chain junction region [Macaca mulatta]